MRAEAKRAAAALGVDVVPAEAVLDESRRSGRPSSVVAIERAQRIVAAGPGNQ